MSSSTAATVRAELATPDGRTLEAEVPRDAWDGLGLARGAVVGLGIRRMAVFPA